MSVPNVLRVVKKRHSQRPYLRVRVSGSDETPFDFTGALSVTFTMVNRISGVEKVNAAGVIVSPVTDGLLEYQWKAVDVDTAGEYIAEFDVDYGAGETMTLPENGNILVTIFEDVNDE
jgi:hypothetical protein